MDEGLASPGCLASMASNLIAGLLKETDKNLIASNLKAMVEALRLLFVLLHFYAFYTS